MDTYYCLTAKHKLKMIIENMSEDLTPFVKCPGKDFSRNRKISFSDSIHFLLSLQSNCLNREILHFYSYSLERPTSSAMLQCRSKLKLEAFEHIFHKFTDACPVTPRFKGYCLFAVDGSRFTFPENKKETNCNVKSPNTEKGHNMIQLNAIYHLGSSIFKDVLFQEIRKLDEHSGLVTMLQRCQFPERSIMIGDRGFESYNTFAHLENKGLYYVIRGKQGKSGILSGLKLPDTEEFDEERSVIICRKHTKAAKEHPNLYKRIRKGAKFDFFSEDSDEYHMKIRVVKLKLANGRTEILYTNLPKEAMSVEDLREIYRKRWGIETAFLQLKHTLGAVALHSKKAEYVLQELYAKLIMYNFCKTIIFQTMLIQKPDWQYVYEIDFSTAVDVCMKLWRSDRNDIPQKVKTLIRQHIHPIREEQSSPRTSGRTICLYFTYRIA